MPVILIGAALYLYAAHTATPERMPVGRNATPEKAQPPVSAPASDPAVKPAPLNEIPKPTVVLNAGEVPAVVFKEPTHDFGRVRSGTDIAQDFEFANTGTGPLEILLVKPG